MEVCLTELKFILLPVLEYPVTPLEQQAFFAALRHLFKGPYSMRSEYVAT